MELRLSVCGVVLVALMVSGGSAQSDVCGVAPLNPKISGGEGAPKGAWPWMVSVITGSSHICGGSLINNQWVLTAVPCVSSSLPYSVILGRHNLQQVDPNEECRQVTRVIRHPNYNGSTFDNDIALMELSSPVTFTDTIRPVCLASATSVFNGGTTTWITGWGRIRLSAPLPPPQTLQQASLPIISNKDCNALYQMITNNMMCAGQIGGGKGACVGDGGGPLMLKYDSVWVQAGVMSFIGGTECGDYPGGFTRVSQYESWINGHISNNQPGFVTVPPMPTTAAPSRPTTIPPMLTTAAPPRPTTTTPPKPTSAASVHLGSLLFLCPFLGSALSFV